MQCTRMNEDIFGLDVSMCNLYRLMQACSYDRNELLEDVFGLWQSELLPGLRSHKGLKTGVAI